MSSGVNKKPHKKKHQKIVVWKVRLIQIVLTVCLVSIAAKAIFLQTIKANSLQKVVNGQRRKANPTRIFRGEITDRNGIVLAVDTARFDLFLRPKDFKASIKQLNQLSKILNIEENRLEELSRKKYISKLDRSLKRTKVDRIAKLRVTGLDIVPTNYREYPHGELAAHLLGFVSWDSSGKGGVEQYLNNSLKSAHLTNNNVLTRSDGRPLTRQASLKPIINSSFGQQVELTIDSKLQYKIEEILNINRSKFKAEKATAIVLQPSSGEIIAWANSPSYDPNKYSSYTPDKTVNWSICQVYEPGSTFKILTVASALQLKAIEPDYKYVDEGKMKIGKRVIKNHDYKPGLVKEIDLTELFQHSSNTGAASIGFKMKPKSFYEQLKKFGISQKTGIEIPGESKGFLRNPKEWKEIDIATTSFGQGAVAVTPIQLASAINSIANDGVWIQPHLLKGIRSADGERLIKKNKPTKRRVISSNVADLVSRYLSDSIRKNLEEQESYIAGTIPGYEVAGKTGTAQKYCPKLGRYCPLKTIASFIGFFPASNPEFLVLVVVDSPREAGGWGNTVAGPIFNQIGETVLKMYPKGLPKEKKFAFFH
ncbi:MAG: penicillin-binding protein 2 [Candidatus Caenarcaniphilales bacterium]|nr:penicillin-binding protein 2 [Candidatus Caenarcaniphilales bacterium]